MKMLLQIDYLLLRMQKHSSEAVHKQALSDRILTGVEYKVKMWEVDTGRMFCTLGHEGSVSSVAYSPDGRYIASGSNDGNLKLWDASTGWEVRSFAKDANIVKQVDYSPDGNSIIAVRSGDKAFRLWDINTGRVLRSFSGDSGDKEHKGHEAPVTSVKFSPDGRYIVSGSEDKTVKLWDVSNGKVLQTFSGYFSGHRGIINWVDFSPDGRYIISASDDKTVRLWEVDPDREKGRRIRTFSGHAGRVYTASFSPDGQYIVSGYANGILKLWKVSNGEELQTFSGHTGRIYLASFSPDGRYILSCSSAGDVKLWDISNDQELRTILGHAGWVTAVAFSPDGNSFLSCAADKNMKLWETQTGRHIRTFSGHTETVWSGVFSHDGHHILSSSSDGTIRLWDVDTGELLMTRIHLNELDWVVVTPDGRFDGSPDGIKLLHYAKGNESIPLDAFFDKFYTPRLVALVMSGEELPPDVPDLRDGFEMPPVVRIISPVAGATLHEQSVDVLVEVVDQGGGVEEVSLFLNGKYVGGNERGMKKVGIRYTYTVSLESGINRLRVTAYSRDYWAEAKHEIKIEVKIAKTTADLYIVSVGIDNYDNHEYNLSCCVTDAKEVVNCLKSHRSEKSVRKILPQTVFNEQATRSGIESALEYVEQNARPEDIFMFYYAGHGVMSDGSRENPVDFYLVSKDVTQMYGNDAMLSEKAISATQLKETCRRIEARKQLLVLDACQAGAAADTFAVRASFTDRITALLAKRAGLVLLASTQSEQFAAEIKELGHGLFTYALLQAMEGEADGSPKDGKVMVLEVSSYVDTEVQKLSENYRGQTQYPKIYIYGQDFQVTKP